MASPLALKLRNHALMVSVSVPLQVVLRVKCCYSDEVHGRIPLAATKLEQQPQLGPNIRPDPVIKIVRRVQRVQRNAAGAIGIACQYGLIEQANRLKQG